MSDEKKLLIAKWSGLVVLALLALLYWWFRADLHDFLQIGVGEDEGYLAPMMERRIVDGLALVVWLLYFKASSRIIGADKFLSLLLISTHLGTLASGSYTEGDCEERGVLGLDLAFPAWLVIPTRIWPTKRFLVHFGLTTGYPTSDASIQSEEAGKRRIVVEVDTSMFFEIRPPGVPLLLTKVGLDSSDRDLSKPCIMKYKVIDSHDGAVSTKRYSVPCMGLHFKHLVENAVHDAVRTAVSRRTLDELWDNAELLVADILKLLKPVFEELGLIPSSDKDEHILERPKFVVEGIVLDSSLRDAYADAAGLKRYLDAAVAGGVDADAALAAQALKDAPDGVTIVAGQGGLIGAVGAHLIDNKSP